VYAELQAVLYSAGDYWGSDPQFPPDILDSTAIDVQALIGPRGSGLADSFDLTICSPAYFAQRRRQPDSAEGQDEDGFPAEIQRGVGYWFLDGWDREKFERALLTICRWASPGPDWTTVALRIAGFLPWEFDYRELPGITPESDFCRELRMKIVIENERRGDSSFGEEMVDLHPECFGLQARDELS
jgi:hypothetical protein